MLNKSATTDWKQPLPRISAPTEERLQPYNKFNQLKLIEMLQHRVSLYLQRREAPTSQGHRSLVFCQLRLTWMILHPISFMFCCCNFVLSTLIGRSLTSAVNLCCFVDLQPVPTQNSELCSFDLRRSQNSALYCVSPLLSSSPLVASTTIRFLRPPPQASLDIHHYWPAPYSLTHIL